MDIVNTNLTLTNTAVIEIRKMNERVEFIGTYFGRESQEYIAAARSLNHSLVTMIGLGGEISKDTDYNLYGVGRTIHYGVNWHHKYRSCPEGFLYPTEQVILHDKVMNIWELPGTWSVNS